MTFLARLRAAALWAFLGLALSSCVPYAPSQLDEEKEPHFLAGKSHESALDYQGAIECFEKALQVNPQSAAAHLELGCLFDKNEADPAAAIYHYHHYLKLQPNAGNKEVIQQRILTCKQELARTVSLGPVTERLQREFEQLTEDNKHLKDQNKVLQEELEKWRAYGSRQSAPPIPGGVTNAGPRGSLPVPSALPLTSSVSNNNTMPSRAASSAGSRTHVVKAGETPTSIARKYGVRLDALQAANPRLDPRRMQVGQTLNIP